MSRLVCLIVSAVVLFLAGTAMAAPPPALVPEIDPGMAAGALTLLVSGALVLAGKRR